MVKEMCLQTMVSKKFNYFLNNEVIQELFNAKCRQSRFTQLIKASIQRGYKLTGNLSKVVVNRRDVFNTSNTFLLTQLFLNTVIGVLTREREMHVASLDSP